MPPELTSMDVHIGCSGWFYSHWRGIFYPAQEVTTKNWFAYYANVFRTVELNAPFYRWPKPATVRRWYREAPPGFIYTVKVNQLITHEKRMIGTKQLVRDYYAMAETLKEKMGCFLFQFPPSFKYSAARLKAIVTQLDPAYRNVIEFRHKSWWQAREVYRTLRKHRIAFCAVSAPRLPEEFPAGQPVAYFRLHGKSQWYRHNYTPAELLTWLERIRASGAREAWVYFDNDRNGNAVKNALQLRRLFRNISGNPPPADGSIKEERLKHAGPPLKTNPPRREAVASSATQTMPQGDKSSYTGKQKRKAEHIEKGYEKKGVSKKTAEKRAWATVNKQDGGGKKKKQKSAA
jgi:uncharacterized protein YecE (DUF72 family)